jgi:hypothetical protein
VAALQKWLFGEASAAPAPKEAPQAPARRSKDPAPKAKSAHEIHAAFADLAQMDKPSAVPSIPPSGPEMDGLDMNEPLLDDDWLADDSIAPAKSKSGDPASGRRSVRAKGEAAGGHSDRRGAGRSVDFAGLLADDDADPGDDEREERAGARPKKRGDRDDG